MFTKHFKKVSAVLLLSAMGVAGLVSCGQAEEYDVNFMLKNDEGTWAIFKTERTVNQTVTVPEAPTKQYYTFGGWYDSETFENAFKETGIKKNSDAYGKYIPEEVTVHINDDNPITKNLVDVVNATYNPGEGLKFDGWYTDAAYTLKWDGKSTVSDLYATSVAVLTFNNGYENVYEEFVKPGTVFTNPAEKEVAGKEEGTKSTLEAEEIVKDYMDLNDIHYLNDDGTAYDFTKPVTKSATINVQWVSRGINKYITKSETSDGYYLGLMPLFAIDSEIAKAPALSYQGKMTNQDGQLVDIEGVITKSSTAKIVPTTAKKVIFGEGLKYVKGFNGPVGNVVEEVELPNSLRILDNSFSNMPNLKSVTLNEGLEVLIGSFWNEGLDPEDENYRTVIRAKEYGFDINVPASVTNLAMVPSNLTFAEGSAFAKENGLIVKTVGEEKTLIADNANLNSKSIVVPEGFTSIQVGTYYNVRFDYLTLPESLKTVSYNAKWEDYKYYQFNGHYDNFLTKIVDNGDGTIDTTDLSAASYSITNMANGYYRMHPAAPMVLDHDGAGFIIFKGTERPSTLHNYAIVGGVTGYEPGNGKYVSIADERLGNKVVVADNVENVYVTLEHFQYHQAGLRKNATAIIPTKASFTLDEIIAELKKQNADVAEAMTTAIAGKELKLYSNNKEITVADVKGEMFISIAITEPAA